MLAAEVLYGERSIDGVSLREITARAKQKNPNALQYHFQNRNGLLQAIVDKHSSRIGVLRTAYLERAALRAWPAAEAAARCLAMPIIDYIEANPEGINFVKIVAQITAQNQAIENSKQALEVRFPQIPALKKIVNEALATLGPREAQRRIHLAVNITFHAIAAIYRTSGVEGTSSPLAARGPMVEQLICMLESFFAAPARSA